jgi:phenylalanyl-tRNA synthetase beta chain
MKLPLSLIRCYIKVDAPLAKVCEALTLLGIEVDRIENEKPRFSHIVCGEILSTRPHPNSNHLTIAQVFDGREVLNIVCGAPNCRPNIKSALARAGAILHDEHGHEMTIAETVIRKVPSQGMLCSASELGIPGDDVGILEIPFDTPNGQDLTELLWDPVLELSLTPNLGHCQGALGIARELSAAFRNQVVLPEIVLSENQASNIQNTLTVTVDDPQACPRYTCRMIEHIKVGPSPFWLQQVLFACGMRPICNVVDISNYILLKTGQPLHAFDYERIDKKSLHIRTVQEAGKFTGLDGVERELPAGALLVCDPLKPLALAGILGGENSAIGNQTQTIVVESAFFDPIAVRKTAKKMKISTESSQRFEKGIDWQATGQALDEACSLIVRLCGGQVVQGTIDIASPHLKIRRIMLRTKQVNRILGTQLSINEVEQCLRRIGCIVHMQCAENLTATIPTYRTDLIEEIDLIEEVARVYGYNHIDRKPSSHVTSSIPHDPAYLFEKEVRHRMIAQGLQEVVTCSLISPRLTEWLPRTQDLLKVRHSKSEDYSVLRPSLFASFLEMVKINLDQKNGSLGAFETSRVHFNRNGCPVEIPMLGIVLTGKSMPHHWDQKPHEFDFYDLKGLIEALMEGLRISRSVFHRSSHASFHPGRQANLLANDLCIGSLGEIHPLLLDRIDIKQTVYFAELNLASLAELRTTGIHCQPLPLYPSTERDWTIPLSPAIEYTRIFGIISSFQSPLLEKTELVDLYRYEKELLPQRNITIRFTYRDPSKTISFEEAEAVHEKLMLHVLSLLGTDLPSF